MSQDVQLKQQLEALKNRGGEVDADAEHEPETARQSSNAGLRREAALQRKAGGEAAGDVQNAAARGVQGSGAQLPHLDKIQASFGAHDVSGIQAHTGGQAAEASRAMGAQAYATGSSVAFAGQPDLHTAAHEAAHVVQQREGVQLKGGVGAAGDSHERQADEVADRVVAGKPAGDLLGAARNSAAPAQAGPVQMKPDDKKAEHHDPTKQEKDAAHDRSGSASHDAFGASMMLLTKHLHDAVPALETAMRGERKKDERGDQGRVEDIETIFNGVWSEAIRVRTELNMSKLDGVWSTDLTHFLKSVDGGWFLFASKMGQVNGWLSSHGGTALKVSQIKSEIEQMHPADVPMDGVDQDRADPGAEASLKTSSVSEHLDAAIAAADSAAIGNSGDVGRIAQHVSELTALVHGAKHSLKSEVKDLAKLVTALHALEVASPNLAATLKPIHAQVDALVKLAQ